MLEYEHVIALLADSENAKVPGPGKFEGCEDERVARALYALSHDHSNIDDQLGSVADEGYWIGWMDRFVMWEDPQGFFSYEVFDTSEEAKESFLGH